MSSKPPTTLHSSIQLLATTAFLPARFPPDPLTPRYRVCLFAVTRCQPLTASTFQRQGYTADNPTATTVGGLGAIRCFAETHVHALLDRAPTVDCPQANGTFMLEGCVQRASCFTLSCSVGYKPLATQTDADAPLLCASSVRKRVFGAIWICEKLSFAKAGSGQTLR